jgi:hypothetical protein
LLHVLFITGQRLIYYCTSYLLLHNGRLLKRVIESLNRGEKKTAQARSAYAASGDSRYYFIVTGHSKRGAGSFEEHLEVQERASGH